MSFYSNLDLKFKYSNFWSNLFHQSKETSFGAVKNYAIYSCIVVTNCLQRRCKLCRGRFVLSSVFGLLFDFHRIVFKVHLELYLFYKQKKNKKKTRVFIYRLRWLVLLSLEQLKSNMKTILVYWPSNRSNTLIRSILTVDLKNNYPFPYFYPKWPKFGIRNMWMIPKTSVSSRKALVLGFLSACPR